MRADTGAGDVGGQLVLVGPGFSLDLIGIDVATGDRVIVENQLEASDHNHLGQILTCAGGTNPAHVLWLATSFREEHRAALEWLNERTDENTRFFAAQVRVVRIGSSPPAPLFTLVVQPNARAPEVQILCEHRESAQLPERHVHATNPERGRSRPSAVQQRGADDRDGLHQDLHRVLDDPLKRRQPLGTK